MVTGKRLWFFYCMPILITSYYLGTQILLIKVKWVITCKNMCFLQTLSVSNTYSNFLCYLGQVPNSVHMCSLQSLSELSLTHINAYALINESIV